MDVGAKQKILNAARQVFAEKGYDGASVSEIAKAAGVNKALPFYYFESKENLLREIVKQSTAENMERQEIFFRYADPTARETIEEYYDHLMDALEGKRETVKILLSESLKSTDGHPILFDFLAPVLEGVKAKLDRLGYKVADPQRLATTELFFDAIPLFMHAVLSEKWAAYSSIPESKVNEDFQHAFKQIYVEYLFQLYFSKVKKEVDF